MIRVLRILINFTESTLHCKVLGEKSEGLYLLKFCKSTKWGNSRDSVTVLSAWVQYYLHLFLLLWKNGLSFQHIIIGLPPESSFRTYQLPCVLRFLLRDRGDYCWAWSCWDICNPASSKSSRSVCVVSLTWFSESGEVNANCLWKKKINVG